MSKQINPAWKQATYSHFNRWRELEEERKMGTLIMLDPEEHRLAKQMGSTPMFLQHSPTPKQPDLPRKPA